MYMYICKYIYICMYICRSRVFHGRKGPAKIEQFLPAKNLATFCAEEI